MEKNKIIKNRSEDELCLTRKGRRGGGAGGRRTASRLGVRAPVFTSSLCLPLTQCCAGRYSNIDVADTKRIPLRITCRTVSFGVCTGLRYFPPYGSTSISFRPSACGFFPGGGLFRVFADSSALFFNAFIEKFFPAEESGRSVSFWQLQFEMAKFFLVDVLKGQFSQS